MDLHIDDFYVDSARCMVSLYQSFPRKSTLYMDDFVGVLERDEVGLPHPRQLQCLSTLIWLGNEGHLRYMDTIGYDALDQCELTQAAFLRLSSTQHPFNSELDSELPRSVFRAQGSLIQQMRRHLKSRDTEKLIPVVRFFLGEH